MTRAKISIFVEAESYDKDDEMGLFQVYGKPVPNEMAARNANMSFDIRVRPIWKEWYAKPTIRYDADQFTMTDVVNLVARAGAQVGLLEGRPDSKQSAGLGFGTFKIDPDGLSS
jgi:hypothetical protein